jgi:hypothetical protein
MLPPFSKDLRQTSWPIVDSFVTVIFGTAWREDAAAIAVHKSLKFIMMGPAQATTAMADIYACSRYIYGLSRGGFVPTKLSITMSSGSLRSTHSTTKSTLRSTNFKTEAFSLTNHIVQVKGEIRSGTESTNMRTNREHRIATESSTTRSKGDIRSGADMSNALGHLPLPERAVPSAIQEETSDAMRSSKEGSIGPAKSQSKAEPKAEENLVNQLLSDPLYYRRTPKYSVYAAGALCLLFNIFVDSIRNVLSKSNVEDALDPVADSLLRMAVWFACCGYIIQLLAYLVIRLRMTTLHRPCPSPSGIPGVVASLLVAGVLGVVAPFMFPKKEVYLTSLSVLGGFLAVFLIYYQLFALPRLTNSPERLFIRYVVTDILIPFLSRLSCGHIVL